MEVLFVAGFVLWALWSVSKLGHATKTYVNPRSTQEQLDEAHGSLGAFWLVMAVLALLFMLSIGGMFTTGFDMGKLENNGSWVMTGEGSYQK